MSRILIFFRDPWKIFTAIALVLLISLVIFSQVWICKSSFQRNGGEFTISTSTDGELLLEDETVKGFSLSQISDGRYRVNQGHTPLYIITSMGPGVLEIKAANGNIADNTSLQEGAASLSTGPDTLWISQKIFTGLFDDGSDHQPLILQKNAENMVRLQYHPGAFLLFADKKTHYTLSNYVTFFRNSKYLSAVKNSFLVMIFSTLIASFFGVGLAYLYARYKVPGTSSVLTIITMASVSPPFLGAYAWRMLLGSSGVITRLFHLNWTIVGLHGVVWVISWLVFPIIFLLTYDAFISLDHSLRECSMSLGGDRKKTFFRIELPMAMPGILNGLYLAMMTAFTDFGTPYVISLNLNVLPVMIYKEYMNEVGGNLSIASTGSMLMIFFSSLILMAQRIYLARRSYASVKSHQPSARQAGKGKKRLIYSLTAVVLAFAFLPHITVAISAFFKWKVGILTSTFTLDNFTRLFRSNLSSVGVTLFTGGTATLLDFVFGIGIAFVVVKKRYPVVTNFLNQLVMVPYLIPGTVLGIGFILLFNQPPIVLTGTWLILVLAYFIRKLPYSVKSAESALYQVHSALGEAAESLGAKPMRSFWQITFPLIIGGVISGATLSFLQIMTEISASIILYRPPWKPMTAVIFENTIDAGADFGIASAMTVLLMVMLYVPLYIVTIKARKPKEVRIESI